MDDKVVPFNRAKEKRVKDDAAILLNISREISEIEDKGTRDNLMDAWRRAALSLFSSAPLPG